MNLNSTRHRVLAVAALVFLFEIYNIAQIRSSVDQLERDAAAMKASMDEHYSAGHMVGTSIKSFFDGFTFGVFAKEGMFTEYNKEENFRNQLVKSAADMETAYDQQLAQIHSAALWRNWALFTCLVGCVYPYAFRFWQSRSPHWFPAPSIGDSTTSPQLTTTPPPDCLPEPTSNPTSLFQTTTKRGHRKSKAMKVDRGKKPER